MSQLTDFIVELYDELLKETKTDYSDGIIYGFCLTNDEIKAIAEFYKNAAKKEENYPSVSSHLKEKAISWHEKMNLGFDVAECRIKISRMADALYRMYFSEKCNFVSIHNSKYHKIVMKRIGEKLTHKELESIYREVENNFVNDEACQKFKSEIWYLMGDQNNKVELAIFLHDNTIINASRLSSILEMNKKEAEEVAKYYKNKKEREHAISWKNAKCEPDKDFQNLHYLHRVLIRTYNENPTAYNLETILRHGFANMPTKEWDMIYRYLCKLDDKKYNRLLEIIWYEYL